MTTQQIKERLCYYDERNPFCIKPNKKPMAGFTCSCDNCYYSRHKLANELLRVKEELTKEKEDFKILERCYLGIE